MVLFDNYAKRDFLVTIKPKKALFYQSLFLFKKTTKKAKKRPPKILLIKENLRRGNHEKNHEKSHNIKIIHKFLSLIFNNLQK